MKSKSMIENKYCVRPLLDHVVNGGFCIGCGACAALLDSPLVMKLNKFGQYEPVIGIAHQASDSGCDAGTVCPFYSKKDENIIAGTLYSKECQYDEKVGYYNGIYAGWVIDSVRRAESSSGGIVTWILEALLDQYLIDGVIHVGLNDNQESGLTRLFGYQVSSSKDEISKRSKSRYYATEFSFAIDFIRNNKGKYAFVGVPCYVKAIRLLSEQDHVINNSIRFCIAIFCGHMKSTAYALSIAWQLGVSPGDLSDIDFRVKRPGYPASRYGVKVIDKKGKTYYASATDLYGTDWGLGFFKPLACDYCDDIAGEVADVTCGDAWLPKYVKNSSGTNIIVVRNTEIKNLLLSGSSNGKIGLDFLNPNDVYKSQAGNYRHRKDGLAYRLWLYEKKHLWHPDKRTAPSDKFLSEKRKTLYEIRSRLSSESHQLFRDAIAAKNYDVFIKGMGKLVHIYHRVNGTYTKFLIKEILRSYSKVKRGLR